MTWRGMPEVCLIDTSAWISFFRGQEPVATAVDAALANGSAAICGMIELEVRQGLRSGEDELLDLLQSTIRLPTQETDFATAGDLLARLRRRGVTLPATDGLIAQVALSHGARLLENDRHFENITNLERYPWRDI